MTLADAQAAAARILPCQPLRCVAALMPEALHSVGCLAHARPAVAEAILAASKQGAEEMRAKAAVLCGTRAAQAETDRLTAWAASRRGTALSHQAIKEVTAELAAAIRVLKVTE